MHAGLDEKDVYSSATSARRCRWVSSAGCTAFPTNRTLLRATIEELFVLRAAAPHAGRYVTRDAEYYGQTLPTGSAMMLLIGAASRDPRRFGEDSESFDVHPERIALDEVLDRFPEWEVDLTEAGLSPSSTVRGWESMPAVLP